MNRLPEIPDDRHGVVAWVDHHLGDLICDTAAASPAFVGGQQAADRALSDLDIEGYARSRSMVWPPSKRGASRLSPYIRHGLLPLRRVWEATNSASSYDRFRYQGELLWQEYSRHWYALYGRASGGPISHEPARSRKGWEHPTLWEEMECVRRTVDELHTDGWMVNQTRMWIASQWSVRAGRDPFEGEDYMFKHLLDGSRAANRMGWQWVAGTSRGRAGGFARQQVMKRAPRFCATCSLVDNCPIGGYARTTVGTTIDPPPILPTHLGFGPTEPLVRPTEPEQVWLTAESLGTSDPALSAYPDLPAVFVFDEPLLKRLSLSGKRLVFLAECLAGIQTERELHVFRGRPVEAVKSIPTAVTFAPVPGFARIARDRPALEIHPWMWLRPLTSRLDHYVTGKGQPPSFKVWCQLSKPETT